MGLEATLTPRQLARLAAGQVGALFCDGDTVTEDDIMPAVPQALARLEHCFSKVGSPYFQDGAVVKFDHLHGDQYAMWLYFLGNELHRRQGAPAVCKKLFLLNKALHGCDIFYEVELPSIFLLVHPLGTVLGRGKYSDYFVAYQRCGVGSNRDLYPSFGQHVTLRPGSSVLGNSRIGNFCQIGADSLVLDSDLPDGTLYLGGPKAPVMRRQAAPYPLWRV